MIDYHRSRRILIALLQRAGDAPVVDIDKLRPLEREELVIGCSLNMLLHAIANAHGYREEEAIAKLQAQHLENRLRDMCNASEQEEPKELAS
jgi:hypothetical protein